MKHLFSLKNLIQCFILQLKTQIQREALLAKEAKYEHGLKKSDHEMYEELINNIKDHNDAKVETSRPS